MLLYDIGHIPPLRRRSTGFALNDPVTRDYIDGEVSAELMRAKGINRDDTVVIYGDKSNWWAAYALWVFTLFGHPDVRLLDGGRDAWMSEDRDSSLDVPEYPRSDYPVVARDDSAIRAFADEVLTALGTEPLIDVRSPQEYTGERTHMPDYPEEGPARRTSRPRCRFRGPRLPRLTAGSASQRRTSTRSTPDLDPAEPTIAYCRIGERSSHTWFVLTHLLGFDKVRNYDGSWTEWGNRVRRAADRRRRRTGRGCVTGLPAPLAEIVDDFAALAESDRATLLLEFAGRAAALPDDWHPEAMELVPECQSPIFLSVDASDPTSVRLHFSAPVRAPTTRGSPRSLHQGLTVSPPTRSSRCPPTSATSWAWHRLSHRCGCAAWRACWRASVAAIARAG